MPAVADLSPDQESGEPRAPVLFFDACAGGISMDDEVAGVRHVSQALEVDPVDCGIEVSHRA
jgi:hypothetical protein